MTFPTIIVTGIGVYGFGMGIEAGQGPIASAIFFGFAIASVVLTINTGFTYVCHPIRHTDHRCLMPIAASPWKYSLPQCHSRISCSSDLLILSIIGSPAMDQGRCLSFVEVLMLGCWSPPTQFISLAKRFVHIMHGMIS